MERINKLIIPVLSILCVISVSVMVWSISKHNEPKVDKEDAVFVPPPFDSSAVRGEPTPPEELGYSELYQDGMSFKVGICGNIILNDNKANIYFYNCDNNDVWLKLRILDESNGIICETGLIKPDEYIESVDIPKQLEDNEKVKLKIMAYEPQTYYSEGSIVLNTSVKVGD